MSTHNICFHGEIRKICRYPLLSGAMNLCCCDNSDICWHWNFVKKASNHSYCDMLTLRFFLSVHISRQCRKSEMYLTIYNMEAYIIMQKCGFLVNGNKLNWTHIISFGMVHGKQKSTCMWKAFYQRHLHNITMLIGPDKAPFFNQILLMFLLILHQNVLWVLIRSASMRHFWRVPTTCFPPEIRKTLSE